MMQGHDPIQTVIHWITLFPLWIWLGETTAWLLGGVNRQGELNPWGLVVMLPFLGVAYVYAIVVGTLVILVPCIFLIMTPFCLFGGGPSACIDLYRGFWPFS